MNSPIIQLLVLLGIAIFLILRLKSVLGSRDGFEPSSKPAAAEPVKRASFDVIEGGIDDDIIDHVPENSASYNALKAMKSVQNDFSVTEFLRGARGAYEMILMGYENGQIDDIRPFLSKEVAASFVEGIDARNAQGLKVEAEFIGIRELSLIDAQFDSATQLGEVTIRIVAEIASQISDSNGAIIEGNLTSPKRQKDVWTFARKMGSDDPNWQLVATDA